MPSAKNTDEYIKAKPEHAEALTKLRRAVSALPLDETIKWGAPCYVYKGKNVVGLAAFKSYVGLWFHQGALLSDPDRVLVNAGKGKTKAQRQWRFGSAKEIRVRAVQAYVREAIGLIDEGKEIKPDLGKPLAIPPELGAELEADPGLKAAFDALSLSRRREYAVYISEAKRDATKRSRLDKIRPMIASSSGLHDKHRSAARPPNTRIEPIKNGRGATPTAG